MTEKRTSRNALAAGARAPRRRDRKHKKPDAEDLRRALRRVLERYRRREAGR